MVAAEGRLREKTRMPLAPWQVSELWDAYSDWWRQGLRVVLHWPEWRIEEWCFHKKMIMLSLPQGMVFFNRRPWTYLADSLVPSDDVLQALGVNLNEVILRVRKELASGFHSGDAGTWRDYDWAEARDRVERALAEIGTALPVWSEHNAC